MNQLAVQLMFGMVLGLALAYPELPSAHVVLSGGPQGGSVKDGKNFFLTCSYNASYPGLTDKNTHEWQPHIEFWHYQDLLGAFEGKFWLPG